VEGISEFHEYSTNSSIFTRTKEIYSEGKAMEIKATITSNVYMTAWAIPQLKISETMKLTDTKGNTYTQTIYSWKWLTGFDWDDPEAFHLKMCWRIKY